MIALSVILAALVVLVASDAAANDRSGG